MREIIISEDFFKSKQLGVCSAGARLLLDNQLIVPCKDCNGNTIYKFNDYRY